MLQKTDALNRGRRKPRRGNACTSAPLQKVIRIFGAETKLVAGKAPGAGGGKRRRARGRRPPPGRRNRARTVAGSLRDGRGGREHMLPAARAALHKGAT